MSQFYCSLCNGFIVDEPNVTAGVTGEICKCQVRFLLTAALERERKLVEALKEERERAVKAETQLQGLRLLAELDTGWGDADPYYQKQNLKDLMDALSCLAANREAGGPG